MAYELQAIVGTRDALGGVVGEYPTVQLGQGVLLIPLTSEVRRAKGLPWLPLTDDASPTEVPTSLSVFCAELSVSGRVGYVEAELFGGAGTQAALLAEGGKIVGRAVVSRDAINTALRFIGVAKAADQDEFDAVGLGARRTTEEWRRAAEQGDEADER